MKISVITPYNAPNFVAFLQAYCLKFKLTEMGHNVFHLEKQDTVKPVVPASRWEEIFFWKYNRRKEYARNKKLIFKKDQEYFQVEQRHKSNADLYIIGSDEVWNISNKKMHDSLYWNLDDLNPIISYATSIGKAKMPDFPKYPDLIRSVEHLDRVLVRDSRTEEFVNEYTGKDPELVCDPSLLVPVEKYGSHFSDRYISRNRCLLIYGYPVSYDIGLQKEIKKAAKQMGLKTVSCGFYQPWCDYNVECGPLEFSSLIRQCEYSLTTTFHGSIFNTLNHANFVCLPGSVKSNEILERFGISDRIVNKETATAEDIIRVLQGPMYDTAAVEERISAMRESSIRKLEEVLSHYQNNSIQCQLRNHCCGCGECAAICPADAIDMQINSQGFLYPVIDQRKCTQCGLCIRSCAFDSNREDKEGTKPPRAVLVKHKDKETRMASRSGGIFTAVTDIILENKGVVYGCRQDGYRKAIHDRAETVEERNRFRGSKYVQSNIGQIYDKLAEDLKSGRQVLFSGTPCQVDAIRNYLDINEVSRDNLYTVDIACYGVPSSLVWSDYTDYVAKKEKKEISSIDYRDKIHFKWNSHKETFYFTDGSHHTGNIFKKMFTDKLSLRDDCFRCPYKNLSRQGDITIADAWGAPKNYPEFCDDKGVSLVLVNSQRGEQILNSALSSTEHMDAELDKLMQNVFRKNWQRPEKYDEFWQFYANNTFKKTLLKFGYVKKKVKKKASLPRRAVRKIRKTIRGSK